MAMESSSQLAWLGTSEGPITIARLSPAGVAIECELRGHTASVRAIVDVSGPLLSFDAEGVVYSWNGTSRRASDRARLPAPDCATDAVATLPGVAAVAYSSGLVRLWSAEGFNTPRLLAQLAAHTRIVTGLSWHAGTQRLASVSEDAQLTVWSLKANSDDAATPVKADLSSRVDVTDHMLQGVALYSQDGAGCIAAVVAYDVLAARLIHV